MNDGKPVGRTQVFLLHNAPSNLKPLSALRTGLRPGAPFFFKDNCYLVIPFVLHAVTFRLIQLIVIESPVAFATELSVAFATASVALATEVVMVEQVGSKC